MNKSITNTVMQQIEQQHITMRPKWHFTLLTATGVVAVGLLTALTAYLVDLITLALRVQGSSRPMYGARNRLADMLTNFPWLLAIAAIAGFALLVWLLHRSTRLYRLRTAWIALAALVVSVALGVLLAYLPSNTQHSPGQHPGYGMSRHNIR